MVEEEPPNLIDRLNVNDEVEAIKDEVSKKTSKDYDDPAIRENEKKAEEYSADSDDKLEEIINENYLPEDNKEAESKPAELDAYSGIVEDDEEYVISKYLSRQYEAHENGLENKDFCPWPWIYSFDAAPEDDCHEKEISALLPNQLIGSKVNDIMEIFTAIYHQSKTPLSYQPSHSDQFQYH